MSFSWRVSDIFNNPQVATAEHTPILIHTINSARCSSFIKANEQSSQTELQSLNTIIVETIAEHYSYYFPNFNAIICSPSISHANTIRYEHTKQSFYSKHQSAAAWLNLAL